jgi:NitT/TauT family transport system ATP-binding protein
MLAATTSEMNSAKPSVGATRGSSEEDCHAIEASALSYTYHEGTQTIHALSAVNLTILEQEFVAIVGPTGCGKTTLLRLVGGLLVPTTGYVSLCGRLATKPSPSVGFVFQRPVLLPWRTIEGNLILPCKMADGLTEARRARIDELLSLTGLDRMRHAYPGEISPGMQQIASFCMALVLDPDVLLMDEPFASIDPLTREALGTQLINVWSAFRKTVIFVTHSIQEAIFLADRVVVLSGRPGCVIANIPVRLPRPRSSSIDDDKSYQEIMNKTRAALQLGMGSPLAHQDSPC